MWLYRVVVRWVWLKTLVHVTLLLVTVMVMSVFFFFFFFKVVPTST